MGTSYWKAPLDLFRHTVSQANSRLGTQKSQDRQVCPGHPKPLEVQRFPRTTFRFNELIETLRKLSKSCYTVLSITFVTNKGTA